MVIFKYPARVHITCLQPIRSLQEQYTSRFPKRGCHVVKRPRPFILSRSREEGAGWRREEAKWRRGRGEVRDRSTSPVPVEVQHAGGFGRSDTQARGVEGNNSKQDLNSSLTRALLELWSCHSTCDLLLLGIVSCAKGETRSKFAGRCRRLRRDYPVVTGDHERNL